MYSKLKHTHIGTAECVSLNTDFLTYNNILKRRIILAKQAYYKSSFGRNKHDIKYLNELTSGIRDYHLDNNVILTGYRSDIPNILNALDIFVHASICPEPYGLVVLEAMAAGKAVIASNEGGPVEMIIDGESGILIEPGNARLLADKLKLLISDKKFRTQLGENAYKRVEGKFSKIDIEFIEHLYKKLLLKQ